MAAQAWPLGSDVTDTAVTALVDEVISLIGASDVDNVASLTAPTGTGDLTLSLDSVSGVSRCLVEIDYELIFVSSVDPTTNVATVFPTGRGYRGTSPASHATGSIVRIRPVIAASAALREINNEILGLFPSLMAATAVDTTVTVDGWAVIPATASAVLDVMCKVDGQWQRLRSWEAQSSAHSDITATGHAVRVPTLSYGDSVRITLGAAPTTVTSAQSWSATGLPESVRPLVALGAACRLLPALDSYRLRIPEAQNQQLPATMLVRDLRARYREMLAQQQAAFFAQYPVRIHFTQ